MQLNICSRKENGIKCSIICPWVKNGGNLAWRKGPSHEPPSAFFSEARGITAAEHCFLPGTRLAWRLLASVCKHGGDRRGRGKCFDCYFQGCISRYNKIPVKIFHTYKVTVLYCSSAYETCQNDVVTQWRGVGWGVQS